MYASVRSVSKAQGVERKVVKHNNKGNKRGHFYYIQDVVKEGKVVKRIVHLLSGLYPFKPARKVVRFKKCIK